MGIFDGLQQGQGLFGNINQRMLPFTQNNQAALMSAGMELMGGGGYQGAARGFLGGGELDRRKAQDALSMELARQRADQQNALFQQGQQDRKSAQQSANQTQAWIAKHKPELVGAPQAVQNEALKQIFAPAGNKGSLVPVPAIDANGDFTLMQVTQDGNSKPFNTPEGYRFMNPYEKSFDSSKGREEGKLDATASHSFKGKAANLENSIRLVDEVINHPSLDQSVGPIQGRLPSFSAGARDFDERVQQLGGEAFMAARAELKGGGQITDYEGQRAEAALARMSQAKSEEDFKKALGEFRDALVRGYNILAEQAGESGMNVPKDDSGWQTLPNGVRIREKR